MFWECYVGQSEILLLAAYTITIYYNTYIYTCTHARYQCTVSENRQ